MVIFVRGRDQTTTKAFLMCIDECLPRELEVGFGLLQLSGVGGAVDLCQELAGAHAVALFDMNRLDVAAERCGEQGLSSALNLTWEAQLKPSLGRGQCGHLDAGARIAGEDKGIAGAGRAACRRLDRVGLAGPSIGSTGLEQQGRCEQQGEEGLHDRVSERGVAGAPMEEVVPGESAPWRRTEMAWLR